MAKVEGIPPNKRILFESLKLHRATVELRYPKGYLYWDVCGRCILEINKMSNEKIDLLQLSTDACNLRFLEHPNAQVTFSSKSLILSATELKNVNIFKDNGPLILDVLKKHLEIEMISRAGFRLFYVLERDSMDEAQKFVSDLDLCSPNASRFKGFGSEVAITQPTIEVRGGEQDMTVRIYAASRADSTEPNAKVNEYTPSYAVVIDVDFSTEDVKIVQFDLEQFIHRSQKRTKDHIAQILNG